MRDSICCKSIICSRGKGPGHVVLVPYHAISIILFPQSCENGRVGTHSLVQRNARFQAQTIQINNPIIYRASTFDTYHSLELHTLTLIEIEFEGLVPMASVNARFPTQRLVARRLACLPLQYPRIN